MSVPTAAISKRELLAYQADVKGAIFRQIRQMFSRLKGGGFTQKEFAARIGMDEGQLSRRLRGDYDLKLETLSDLARGLECRIDVKLTPLVEAVVAKRELKPSPVPQTDPPLPQIKTISASPARNDNNPLPPPRIEPEASLLAS